MLERLPEFIGNHPFLSFAFVGLLAALIYTEVKRRFRGFAEASPSDVTRLINQEDAAVVDLSGQNDYEQGHIPNAIHVPASQVDPEAKPLSRFKERPLVVYCKTGQASEQAAQRLSKAGFAQVHWLSGGLQSWIGDQLPVAKGKH